MLWSNFVLQICMDMLKPWFQDKEKVSFGLLLCGMRGSELHWLPLATKFPFSSLPHTGPEDSPCFSPLICPYHSTLQDTTPTKLEVELAYLLHLLLSLREALCACRILLSFTPSVYVCVCVPVHGCWGWKRLANRGQNGKTT